MIGQKLRGARLARVVLSLVAIVGILFGLSIAGTAPQANAEPTLTVLRVEGALPNGNGNSFVMSVSEPANITGLTLTTSGPAQFAESTATSGATDGLYIDNQKIDGATITRGGTGNKTLTVTIPSGVTVQPNQLLALKWGTGFNRIQQGTLSVTAQLAAVTPEPTDPTDPTDPGTPTLPDVSPSADIEQVGTGGSQANYNGTVLTMSTTKIDAGPVREIKLQLGTPGIHDGNGWSLRIDGTEVPAGDYQRRFDADTVYYTFTNQRELAAGTTVQVGVPYTASGETGGSLELWRDSQEKVPPEPVDPGTAPEIVPDPWDSNSANDLTKGYTQLIRAGLTCNDAAFALDRYIGISMYPSPSEDQSVEGDISMIAVKLSQTPVTTPAASSRVQVRNNSDPYNPVVYRTLNLGVDYTITVDGDTAYYFFNTPIRSSDDRSDGYVDLRIYSADRSLAGCDVTLWRKAREIPTTCQPGDLTNPNGAVVPNMGNGGPIVARKGPRELTPAELAAGNRVYVTTSSPDSSFRYSSQLKYQVQGSNDFIDFGDETGWIINALGYNPQDNWLYAISQPRIGDHNIVQSTSAGGTIEGHLGFLEDPCFPAGHLLQIDPVSGQIYDLGKVTKPGTDEYGIGGDYDQAYPNDLWFGVNNGFFDAFGRYWVSNSGPSGSQRLYNVDVADVTATTYGNPDVLCADGTDPFCAYMEDMTVLPQQVNGQPFSSGNYAWGIRNNWAPGDGDGVFLERLNLETGIGEKFDITDLATSTGLTLNNTRLWSKAWTYANGDLGFGTGGATSDQTLVRLRVTNPDSANPQIELVSMRNDAPESWNTNGTSNFSSVDEANLSIRKEYLTQADGRISWRITVTNNGPGGSSGFLVEDRLPEGYTDVKMTTDNDDVYFQTNTAGTVFMASFGPLENGQSAAIEFDARLPEGSIAECVSNTATVTGNESDPTTEDNTGTAEYCGPDEISLRLRKVDYENQNLPLGADFLLADAQGDPANPAAMTPADGGEAIVVTADEMGVATVDDGQYYFLIETRAPAGYSLLAQPVLLHISRGANGNAVVEFPIQASAFPAVVEQSGTSPDTVVIKLADVHSGGNLPRTGGIGWWPYALGALALVVAAAAVARRKA